MSLSEFTDGIKIVLGLKEGPDENGGSSSGTNVSGEEGPGLDDPDDINRDLIAPEFARFDKPNKAKVGQQWSKTMFVNNWPEEPEDGFLHNAVNTPDNPSDVSLHLFPRDTRRAVEEMEEIVKDLDKQLDLENDFLEAQDRSREYQEAEAMLNTLKNTNTELFEVSMYLTARSNEEDGLRESVEEIQTKFEGSPALLDLVTAMFTQKKGLQSVSPIGDDVLGNHHETRRQKMMGGAVASMLMWTSPSIIEENGVEFGLQSHNGSPIVVNRFNRGNGYNQFTVGKIGSGKSFSTKLNLLRTYASRDDTILFMLDPLEGFGHVARRFQGEHVVVGGNQSFNPMEIRPPNDSINEETLQKMNPLKQKIEGVMSFLGTFFAQQGHPLEDKREILSTAVNKAYERRGITPNPETHSKESPTIRDVIQIVKLIADNPEKAAISASDAELEKVENDAAYVLVGLRPFLEGREMGHLGKATSVDLDDDVVYLDLRQQEASGSPGLMMQLLFEQVYQRAKQSDKNVMFAIDEAHMIIKDAESLDFLEQAVRHSRHYNLSINFITQTVDEFFERDQAATIAGQCSIKLLHRVEDLSENSAQILGLSELERQYVMNAKTGKDSDYSEALIGVGDAGYIPIQVHALQAEAMIIDYEGYLEEERNMDINVEGEAESMNPERQ